MATTTTMTTITMTVWRRPEYTRRVLDSLPKKSIEQRAQII
jgi:hypothetical protein